MISDGAEKLCLAAAVYGVRNAQHSTHTHNAFKLHLLSQIWSKRYHFYLDQIECFVCVFPMRSLKSNRKQNMCDYSNKINHERMNWYRFLVIVFVFLLCGERCTHTHRTSNALHPSNSNHNLISFCWYCQWTPKTVIPFNDWMERINKHTNSYRTHSAWYQSIACSL